MTRGEICISAGRLAERVAFDLLGVKEPEYEIKAVRRQEYRAVVRADQLEVNVSDGKIYCFVIYSRPSCRIGNGKRRAKITVEEAFAENDITIALVPAEYV